MEQNKLAYVRISRELLIQVLFPEGTRFLSADIVHGQGEVMGSEVIEFKVENPSLPEVQEGDVIPLRPIYAVKHADGSIDKGWEPLSSRDKED